MIAQTAGSNFVSVSSSINVQIVDGTENFSLPGPQRTDQLIIAIFTDTTVMNADLGSLKDEKVHISHPVSMISSLLTF